MLQRPVEFAVESGLLMVVGITMPHNNGIEVFAALTRTSVPRAAHAGC